MSAKQAISALLATRGKGGSIESISQAGSHFKADKMLAPSDFITGSDKLEASKATTLLGGYAVAIYGFEPKDAFTMRNAFAKRTNEVIDLFDGSKELFISGINKIEADLAKVALDKSNLELALGTDAERYAKTATQAIEKVSDANVSPKVRHDLLTLRNLIDSKLAYAPLKVAQNA